MRTDADRRRNAPDLAPAVPFQRPFRRTARDRQAAGAPRLEEIVMSVGAILLIVLIILLIGAVPSWPYSRGWGYFPSGLLGTILIIVVILMLLGRITL
jgi:hypothetical protein